MFQTCDLAALEECTVEQSSASSLLRGPMRDLAYFTGNSYVMTHLANSFVLCNHVRCCLRNLHVLTHFTHPFVWWSRMRCCVRNRVHFRSSTKRVDTLYLQFQPVCKVCVDT